MPSIVRRLGALIASLITMLSTAAAADSKPADASRAWSLYETSRDGGHRLTKIDAPASAQTAARASLVLACETSKRFQEIVGFGGALTESSAWVLAQLPPAKREEILRRYFDPRAPDSIRYTLARTHINSCDFSLKIWSLDDTPGDTGLRDFTLAPMREWVLPLIHDAQRIAGTDRFKLLASPWSPPAWMKTNDEMPHGGGLRPEYRDAWARFYVRFVETLAREENIRVWALTVQNEPEAKQRWESCLYTPEEERDFVRDHLGPALEKSGHSDVLLLGWDHNRDRLEARAAAMLGDPACAKYLWGLALHWYVSEDFSASSRVLAQFPAKHILFTEGCVEGGAKAGRWDAGERYARNIMGDLRNGVCGWIDWNIALDMRGGPNHVKNFCDAPVLIDTASGEVTFQSSFYAIGHFSRFVEPGAHRIDVGGGFGGDSIESIAFQNPDGAIVVVVLNKSDAAARFALRAEGRELSCAIPAHAIQTYIGAVRE